MGTLLVNERMLETYLYARDHFLKPGGKMFPVSSGVARSTLGRTLSMILCSIATPNNHAGHRCHTQLCKDMLQLSLVMMLMMADIAALACRAAGVIVLSQQRLSVCVWSVDSAVAE